MSVTNTQITLARRPAGAVSAADFGCRTESLAPIGEGEFRLRNHYLSLDAGFRQWMNAGAGDNYMPAMALDASVSSIVLGEVIASRHSAYPLGSWVMARAACERYSTLDGTDVSNIVEPFDDLPLFELLAALGPGGLTAYFGLFDVGMPRAGDTVLVNAAAGGVGAMVGQMAKLAGCRTIGMTGSAEKCARLTAELGYDAAINYRASSNLADAVAAAAPSGVDVFFDNVGGAALDAGLLNLAEGARIVLCGTVAAYESEVNPGIQNLWQLITKRASARGFMFTDYTEQYAKAMADIAGWLRGGKIHSPVTMTTGIENTGQAFADMMNGTSTGKCIVSLLD